MPTPDKPAKEVKPKPAAVSHRPKQGLINRWLNRLIMGPAAVPKKPKE